MFRINDVSIFIPVDSSSIGQCCLNAFILTFEKCVHSYGDLFRTLFIHYFQCLELRLYFSQSGNLLFLDSELGLRFSQSCDILFLDSELAPRFSQSCDF